MNFVTLGIKGLAIAVLSTAAARQACAQVTTPPDLPTDLQSSQAPPPNVTCKYDIRQSDLDRQQPLPFNKAGDYCIREDLTFRGVGLTAISIRADEVRVWFLGHTLKNTLPVPNNARGIEIQEGCDQVSISGGRIKDFDLGIYASGTRDKPVVGLGVRQMRLVASTDSAVFARWVVNSAFEANALDGNIFGISIHGASQGTVIRSNTIRIGALGGWGIALTGTQVVRVIGNTVSIDENVAAFNTGIWVFHGSYHSKRADWGRDNIIQNNVLLGLKQAIVLDGSGQGTNNAVRSNSISGSDPSYRPRYPGPWKTSAIGIFAENEQQSRIEQNKIVSGAIRTYKHGILLTLDQSQGTRIMSVARQANGLPALSGNETCGTQYPLTIPSGANVNDFDDGSNRWETCFAGVPQ